MSNIRDLFSDRRRDNDDENSDDEDGNNRYVGGIGDRGGGSGLAVRPNPNHDNSTSGSDPEAIFRLAQNASSDDQAQVRRTITMYRNGFVVDDGPYRRLDDPNNREFLTSLAKGQTPRELIPDANADSDGSGSASSSSSTSVVVGLVDKRHEDYVETFQSFSGAGQSLGGGVQTPVQDDDTVFDAATLTDSDTTTTTSSTTTAIQVRLLNGQRRVVRIPLDATVAHLAAQVRDAVPNNSPSSRFRLMAGFPPQPLQANRTILEAGLKGAQVSMQAL